MQLRRLLEFAVVIVILGVLAGVLRGRFEAIQSEARSVQLRMAAEAVRSNAQLLQIKCPDWADADCLQRALAGLQRPSLRPEAGDAELLAPASLPGGLAQQRLWAAVSATGLPTGQGAAWSARPLAADRLELALLGVTDCRFLLRADVSQRSIRVEDIQSVC